MERNSLIIEGKYSPLMQFCLTSLSPISHMVKQGDLPFFEKVCEYLAVNGAAFRGYLGGSAPKSWIFDGIQDYNDLDILIRGKSQKGITELSRVLEKAADGRSPLKISNSPNHPEYAFVTNELRARSYVNFHEEDGVRFGPTYRFIEIPKAKDLDRTKNPHLKMNATVDVSLWTGNPKDLEKTILELQIIGLQDAIRVKSKSEGTQ